MARIVAFCALGLLVCVYAAPGSSRGGNGEEEGIHDTTGNVKNAEKDNYSSDNGGSDKDTENNKGNEHAEGAQGNEQTEGVRSNGNNYAPDNLEVSKQSTGSGGLLAPKESQDSIENGDKGGEINHGNSAGSEIGNNNSAVKNSDKSNDLSANANNNESGHDGDVSVGKETASRYKRDESRGKGNQGGGGGNRGIGGNHGGGGNPGGNHGGGGNYGGGGKGAGGNGQGSGSGEGENGGGVGGRHRRSTSELNFKSKGGKGGGGYGGGRKGGGKRC